MNNYQIARRARIGVLVPSTNTGVEYDLQKFVHRWHHLASVALLD